MFKKNLLKKEEPPSLPSSQEWFIQKRYKNFGYKTEEGFCCGVANEGAQAFLLNKLDQFNLRYQLINELSGDVDSDKNDINAKNSLQGNIKEVKNKVRQWSKEAREEVEKQNQKLVGSLKQLQTEWQELPQTKVDEKKQLLNQIRDLQHLINQSTQTIINEKMKTLSTREQTLLDMEAAAETVAILQNPGKYYENTETIDSNYKGLFTESLAQHSEKVFALVQSKELEDKGGIRKLSEESLSMPYTQDSLTKSFELLRMSFEDSFAKSQIPIRLALPLSSFNHAITVGFQYDPTKEPKSSWTFIDANNLPAVEINHSDQLAEKVFSAFLLSDNSFKPHSLSEKIVTFCTNFYTTSDQNEIVKTSLEKVKQNQDWKNLYEVTEKKTGIIDNVSKCSWLLIASKNGQTSTVELLLQKKANVNAVSQDNATPLYIASQNGHAEIVAKLLKQGADPEITPDKCLSPEGVAMKNGHKSIMSLFFLHRECKKEVPKQLSVIRHNALMRIIDHLDKQYEENILTSYQELQKIATHLLNNTIDIKDLPNQRELIDKTYDSFSKAQNKEEREKLIQDFSSHVSSMPKKTIDYYFSHSIFSSQENEKEYKKADEFKKFTEFPELKKEPPNKIFKNPR